MLSKKSKLYAIADEETCRSQNINLVDFVRALINGGIEIIQYRNKADTYTEACKKLNQILKLCKDKETVIVNDSAPMAKAFHCALHLGQDDQLENFTGFWGRSTHSLAEVNSALAEKPQPHYIAFGAVFKSGTKPDVEVKLNILDEVLKLWKNDIVLIGGICLENIHSLPKSPRIYYALIRDFFADGPKPLQIEKRVKKLLKNSFDNSSRNLKRV